MFPKLVKETSVSWDPRKPVGHAEAMDRRFAGMAPKKPVSCYSLETAKKTIQEKCGKVWKSDKVDQFVIREMISNMFKQWLSSRFSIF
jgi:hypothetical protein